MQSPKKRVGSTTSAQSACLSGAVLSALRPVHVPISRDNGCRLGPWTGEDKATRALQTSKESRGCADVQSAPTSTGKISEPNSNRHFRKIRKSPLYKLGLARGWICSLSISFEQRAQFWTGLRDCNPQNSQAEASLCTRQRTLAEASGHNCIALFLIWEIWNNSAVSFWGHIKGTAVQGSKQCLPLRRS